MPDSIELKIGWNCEYSFTKWKSYNIESDIYQAADAFTFELVPEGDFKIKGLMRAELYINGELELTGLIDNPKKGYDINGDYISVTGRDTVGLIVDSCCEQFVTLQNSNLKKAAEKLLSKVSFVKLKNIEYDDAAQKRDTNKPYIQIDPGSKIFDVLKDLAVSRGLVFYSRADGTLVFRKPRGRGRCRYQIIRKADIPNDLIIKAEYSENYGERYSKYTVVSQEQGQDSTEPAQINSSFTAPDNEFPKSVYKPFVESVNDEKTTPQTRANMLLEQRRAMSDTVTYKVKGHSFGQWNWAVDELVRVDDERLDIHKEMLVYARTFSGNSEGQFTDLKLGTPGLLA